MKTRRGFRLAGAGALATYNVLAQAPSRYAGRKAVGRGQTYLNYVLYNPQLNPDFSGVPTGAEFFVRLKFPFKGKDIMETVVPVAYIVNKTPISHFMSEVRDVQITGTAADGEIALYGKIVGNLQSSSSGF